jgi:hypothetical protein
MTEFIREGGWPMFPVLVCGALSLATAVRYAVAPRRELLALVIGLGVTTVILGCLGAALGVQQSARYIGTVEESKRWIFLIGLKESLNDLVAALVFAVLDGLIATAGAYRGARMPEPALSRAA